MTISLSPEHEKFIQNQLENGKYKTAAEVIADAFKALEERNKTYEQWVQETREKVAVGLAELDRGEGIDGELVVERLREKFRQARERQP